MPEMVFQTLSLKIKKSNPSLLAVFSLVLLMTGFNRSFGQIIRTDFVINGNTVQVGDSCFQLTKEQNNNGGSIWFKTRIDLNFDFEVSASINLGRLDGSGADGIAFVLQPLNSTIGGLGGGLGYQGVSPSIAVEFDTWQNDDPSYDHIALVQDGILDHYGSPNFTLQGPVAMLLNQANAEDGQYKNVQFKWDATQKRLTAYYAGVLKIDYTGDIINTIFKGSPFVYWGFTAATGGAINDQRVCISKYEAIKENECPPLVIETKNRFCKGDTIRFSASHALSYSWSGPGNFSSTLKNPIIIDADINNAGNYKLIVTDSCNEIDSATINIVYVPDPIIFAGNDTTINFGSSLQLNPVVNTNPVLYKWTPAVSLSCTDCRYPTASPEQLQQYTVAIKTQDGCTASDSIIISLDCSVNLIAPAFICEGDTVTLSATMAKSYLWIGPNNFTSTLRSPDIINVNQNTTGVYTLISNANTYCADTNDITISLSTPPTVDAGKDTTISMGTSFQLSPYTSDDVKTFQWTPSDNLSCINCSNPFANPRKEITYTLRGTTDNGCASSDSIHVSVICTDKNYFIPNTFSPNQDGVNDFFYPRGQYIQRVVFLRVFNRWGEKVFEQNDFDLNDKTKGWDGSYKGKKLDKGVFAYTTQLICDNGQIIDLKGSIMILQ